MWFARFLFTMCLKACILSACQQTLISCMDPWPFDAVGGWGGGGVPFDRDTNNHGQTPFPVILLATSLWIGYNEKTISLAQPWRKKYPGPWQRCCSPSLAAARTQVLFHIWKEEDVQNTPLHEPNSSVCLTFMHTWQYWYLISSPE